jgi:hypothetical protein
MKRYTDEEREAIGAACYDCHLPYGDDGWADLLLPNSIWEQINPSHHKGVGLLCANCTMRRLVQIGLSGNVPFYFASGPFSFSIRG